LKKSNTRIIAWSAVLLATVITFLLVFRSLMPEQYRDFAYVIVGTAIIELSFFELTKRLSEPSIIIEPCSTMKEVGFAVRVKDRFVNDVKPICNDIEVPWDNLKGDKLPSVKLQVGANPSRFFPFYYEFVENGVSDTEQSVAVNLYQKQSSYGDPDKPHPVMIASGYYIVPLGEFEPIRGKIMLKPNFEAHIRIIGDEIGEEVNRLFNVTFCPVMMREIDSNNFEDIEFSGLSVDATEKRFFWKRRYFNDIDVELIKFNFRARKREETLKKITP